MPMRIVKEVHATRVWGCHTWWAFHGVKHEFPRGYIMFQISDIEWSFGQAELKKFWSNCTG